jgi:predicted DNA binding CopG/RHH family protein
MINACPEVKMNYLIQNYAKKTFQVGVRLMHQGLERLKNRLAG